MPCKIDTQLLEMLSAYHAKRDADQKRKKLITETINTCDEAKLIALLEIKPALTDDEKRLILQGVVSDCGLNIGLIETVIAAYSIDLAKLHKSKSLSRFFSSNPAALRHFMTKEELVPLFKQSIASDYVRDVGRANTDHNEPDPKIQPVLDIMKEFMDSHGIANRTHRNPSVFAQLRPGQLFGLCNKRAINEGIDRIKANLPVYKSELNDLFNFLISGCNRPDIGEFLGRFIDELGYKPALVLTSFETISKNRHALKYLMTRPDFEKYLTYHIPSRYKSTITHMIDRAGINLSKPVESLPEFEDYQAFMTTHRIPFAQPNNYRRDRIAEEAKERLIRRAERLARDEDRIVTKPISSFNRERAINAAKSGREYTRRAWTEWKEMLANPKSRNRSADLDLIRAASKCDISKVRAALSAGASTTAIGKGTGSIPLAYFITNCKVPLEPGMPFSEENEEMIEMLMRGVNDDPTILCSLDHMGRSLLELAVIAGNNGMAYKIITETDFVNLRPDIAQMLYDHAEGRVINHFGYGTYYGTPISYIVSQFLKAKLSYIPEEARRPADISSVADVAARAAHRAPAATAVSTALAAASEAMKELPFEAKVTPESLTVTEYADPDVEKASTPSPEVEAAIIATVAEPAAAASGGSGNFNGLGLNNAGIDLSLFNNTSAAEQKNNSFNSLIARAAAKGITLPAKLTKRKYASRLKNFLNALNANNSSSNSGININALGGRRRTLKSKKRT